LLEVFAKLDFDLHTTDFVLEEIKSQQRVLIDRLIDSDRLYIIETEQIADYKGINSLLTNTRGLSFEDCSVWYYSKKMNAILLTGDGRLRKYARKDNVAVQGILFVFVRLIEQGLLSYGDAILKMQQLIQLNIRLPQAEIDILIREWEAKK
jgi:predicted nucleic acid-binding protein